FFCAFVNCAIDLFAEDYSAIDQSTYEWQAEEAPAQADAAVTIKGIVLVGCEKDLFSDLQWQEGCATAYNLALPWYPSDLLANLQTSYLGKPVEESILLDIKEDILEYYRNCHHPFAIVEIPEQNITCGIIQFIVIEART